jgi:hypothetical protein
MPGQRDSNQVFEEDFLPLRAKLIEIAASLDRIDRAGGLFALEGKRDQVYEAIRALLRSDDDRAQEIQRIFSRPYEENWRNKLGVRE